MHLRLVNWGIAMRGGLPGYTPSDGDFHDPDLIDAQIVEGAMVAMRRAKYLHYALLKYVYVRGKSDVEAANYFCKSELWVQDRHREGLNWVIKFLHQGLDDRKTTTYAVNH